MAKFFGLLRRKAASNKGEGKSPAPTSKPKAFSLKKAHKLGTMANDKLVTGWEERNIMDSTMTNAYLKHIEKRLVDKEFVDNLFEKLITAQGADDDVYKSMMHINDDTKRALVRQNLRSKHGIEGTLFQELKDNAENKENEMVREFSEASHFVPAKKAPGDEDKALKRKRSSISLRRVKSFATDQRMKVQQALRRRSSHVDDMDSTRSTDGHPGPAECECINCSTAESGGLPLTAGEKTKNIYNSVKRRLSNSSLKRRLSIDSLKRRQPNDNCDKTQLQTIAKDDGEAEEPIWPEDEGDVLRAKKMEPNRTDRILRQIQLHGKEYWNTDNHRTWLVECDGWHYDPTTQPVRLPPSPIHVDPLAPHWDPRLNRMSSTNPPQRDIAASDNHAANIRYMRNYFTPGSEPEPKDLGLLDFEEALRHLLVYARGTEARYVKNFAIHTMPDLMATITSLANMEFRPATHTKTFRALLSILLVLFKLPWTTPDFMHSTHDFDQFMVEYHNSEEFDNMFKALIEMKFSSGEARRGFSNFRDRRLVIEVMTAWVQSDFGCYSSQESRARRCLEWFRDPKVSKTHDFIQAMAEPRPYTRWFTELKKSTEGFGGVGWIWHNRGNKLKFREASSDTTFNSYYAQHRPLAALKPDKTCSTVRSHTETLVTCYIAATVDLMTIMVSSLTEKADRVHCRAEFMASRFDELFLSRFLKASTTNFPVVHQALSTWYTASRADGASME